MSSEYVVAALERDAIMGAFLILFFGIGCLIGGIKIDQFVHADAFANNKTIVDSVENAKRLDVEKGYRNCIIVPVHHEENLEVYVCKANP